MKQLGGIDATFLYMETPETPMHVAGLTLYEPPENFSGSFFEHFKKFFLTRMHLAPIFEKKLARTVLELDHPLWVDAGELDFDYHLRRATLPNPGTWRQLEELVGDLHSVPLDRTRPLWQFTVIDGLDDGNVAIYSKVHHAAVDGGAGMAIAAALYDMSPVPRNVKPPEPKKKVRKPSIEERAILGINDAVQNVIRQQLNVDAGDTAGAGHADRHAGAAERRRRQASLQHSRHSGRAGAENAIQRHHHQPALLCGARFVADRCQAGEQGDGDEDQ